MYRITSIGRSPSGRPRHREPSMADEPPPDGMGQWALTGGLRSIAGAIWRVCDPPGSGERHPAEYRIAIYDRL
jgi:hypothetical protein